MGDFDFGGEGFIGGVNSFGHEGEHGGLAGEAFVFGGGDVGFFVPEGVEHADGGGALAGEVVEVEELKAADVGSAEEGFDFLLVEEGLEFAGGHEEVVGLISHAGLDEEILEDFKIAGMEGAGVFLDFVVM